MIVTNNDETCGRSCENTTAVFPAVCKKITNRNSATNRRSRRGRESEVSLNVKCLVRIELSTFKWNISQVYR